MKTEEYFAKFAELQTRALVDVMKRLSDIAISDITFDPSVRVQIGVTKNRYGVGYNVNDDDSYSVGLFVRQDDRSNFVSMNKEEALSFAGDVIAFAMHLDEMNDPNI